MKLSFGDADKNPLIPAVASFFFYLSGWHSRFSQFEVCRLRIVFPLWGFRVWVAKLGPELDLKASKVTGESGVR